MERISVIAPVYNEKENIKRFIEKVEIALKKRFDSYEIILIKKRTCESISFYKK